MLWFSMLYTQAQLRSAVGLGPEAIRHWRKVLPRLAAKRGRTSQFSFGDLLALAVIRELTECLGISVGRLGSASESLFELCNGAPSHGLERCSIIFDGNSFSARREPQQFIQGEAAIIVPIRSILLKLREDLVANQIVDAQATFLFPPTAIGG